MIMNFVNVLSVIANSVYSLCLIRLKFSGIKGIGGVICYRSCESICYFTRISDRYGINQKMMDRLAYVLL